MEAQHRNIAGLIHLLLDSGDPQKEIVLKRNEILRSKKTADSNIYFVAAGSIRVFIEDGDAEQNIRFGYQNDLVVYMDAFLSGKPSSYFIQALKKTTLKVVPKETLNRLLGQHPEQLKVWLALLEELVLQLLEREKDILTSSPAERYHRLLQRSPRLFQEISNRHIANYLRMSPETLSRLKKH
ncbi:Crp/Fnr family transcriptional regulator [Niabella drilacis]|uniref:cAMP-binding domain of CRP or a regulatory subunit of cAMP-dependent protein kinases n=1 Tax=Niabella drilacis (strain DSM 25811 / CCM 8410 / CCUG 62505 / LMG 26954 / E90) TaxID=1285928 RepID=A0A1G6IRM2_NIADE|nr:Crp/Fnr family transcriptional regulator [Niabella drilacis]SDC09134.1 cAMP-binding domain of CRP or a regulatory subunit of cAMP-dependent protein kinases [Niabella drilacis]